MAVIINTNVDSIKIQNILTKSTNAMSTSMERMSTGLKVNSAKDDAAGTVISARMNVQLNGNEICQKNVQNGNAMLATAEGNLDVVEENLSRIRDLTLQAKNGTYSDEEISAMQDEVKERIAEIDRISTSSKYSQLNLFNDADMQADGVTFQVGANSSSDNTISADKSLFASVEFEALTGRDGEAKKTDDGTQIKEYAADTGAATFDAGKYYKEVKAEDVEFKADGTVEDGFMAAAKDGKVVYFAVKDAETDGYTKGDAMPADTYKAAKQVDAVNDKGLDLTALTKDEMAQAIDDLDKALDNVTGRKSLIGSAQNRLDSALSTLTTQYENLSSAKSIITDADIAAEASSFTQNQILQQVSTSLLAQANQAPSIALSLV